VIKKIWSPLDSAGVLDGYQRISITIRHTHTIGQQLKFFGHPRGKARDNFFVPKMII
jgi:hypothetical protein